MKYNEPFPNWQRTKLLPPRLADTLASSVPSVEWPHWVRYSSAWESHKRTCRDPINLPSVFTVAMAWLTSVEFTGELRTLTGIPDLIPDPFYHGGGLHVTDLGGRLDTHVDYALHPVAPFLERRINLVVFLNECEGGRLQLWNDDASKVVREYAPYPNTAAMWECSDIAYHGVTEVTGTTPRATLAVYYCSPARPGTVRKRALFCPSRESVKTFSRGIEPTNDKGLLHSEDRV